jgi:hypothetical protein
MRVIGVIGGSGSLAARYEAAMSFASSIGRRARRTRMPGSKPTCAIARAPRISGRAKIASKPGAMLAPRPTDLAISRASATARARGGQVPNAWPNGPAPPRQPRGSTRDRRRWARRPAFLAAILGRETIPAARASWVQRQRLARTEVHIEAPRVERTRGRAPAHDGPPEFPEDRCAGHGFDSGTRLGRCKLCTVDDLRAGARQDA